MPAESSRGRFVPGALVANLVQHNDCAAAIATIRFAAIGEGARYRVAVDTPRQRVSEHTEQAISVSSVHCHGAAGGCPASRFATEWPGTKNWAPSASPTDLHR
ncbi:hypothetical protein [Nocardia sp. CA-120079]|uniref:hypothetical protein n=1 Tax=Nocardia sp. CA-120079 TaxID=3239974 RepID=UPI003D96E34F